MQSTLPSQLHQENANASGVRTSYVHWHAIGAVEPTTRPNVLLIVHVRLTRRWENETELPSFRGLAPLYGVIAAKRAAGVA